MLCGVVMSCVLGEFRAWFFPVGRATLCAWTLVLQAVFNLCVVDPVPVCQRSGDISFCLFRSSLMSSRLRSVCFFRRISLLFFVPGSVVFVLTIWGRRNGSMVCGFVSSWWTRERPSGPNGDAHCYCRCARLPSIG